MDETVKRELYNKKQPVVRHQEKEEGYRAMGGGKQPSN